MYAFSVTTEIQHDLDRLEELRDALDGRGVLPRRWAGRLRRELEAESVAASTSMEGVPVTVDEVRRILAGDRPITVSGKDAELVEGYRDAMSLVPRRADDPNFRWEPELIREIHDRLMGGSYARGAGRYRQKQVFLAIEELGLQVYEPPLPEVVPGLVDELAAFASAESGRLEAPVLSALVHVRLAGIHPFPDGNGRTARILASLAMYRGGYRLPEFTSLEEWWGTHRAEYYRAFGCLDARWDEDADVTPFVEAHVRAQRLQVDALSLRQAAERQVWTILEDIATEELKGAARLADALYDAFFGRPVTNRYYRGLADISIATATNDLARLDAAALLDATGRGRSTAYVGSRRLLEAVARGGGVEEALPDPATPLDSQRSSIIAALAERLHDGAR
jgi:Fic family protein